MTDREGKLRELILNLKKGILTYKTGDLRIDVEEEPGLCWKFAHQVVRLVTGEWLWPVALPNAWTACSKLSRLHVSGKPQPGDLLFWPDRGPVGHVAVYVGSGEILENTTSRRGTQIIGSIRTGKDIPADYIVVRPPVPEQASAEPNGAVMVTLNGDDTGVDAVVVNGIAMVSLRQIGEALGYVVTDHIKDENKVYLYPRSK